MNITFLGATKTVTGSNFLVEGAGKKFLVDCGMYQGKAAEEMENEDDNINWACNLLQNLAKYVFKSGKWFEEFHFIL